MDEYSISGPHLGGDNEDSEIKDEEIEQERRSKHVQINETSHRERRSLMVEDNNSPLKGDSESSECEYDEGMPRNDAETPISEYGELNPRAESSAAEQDSDSVILDESGTSQLNATIIIDEYKSDSGKEESSISEKNKNDTQSESGLMDQKDSPSFNANILPNNILAETDQKDEEMKIQDKIDRLLEQDIISKLSSNMVEKSSSNQQKTAFEEIDVSLNTSEKDKLNYTEEVDALGEDRTQIIMQIPRNESGSPMDVDDSPRKADKCLIRFSEEDIQKGNSNNQNETDEKPIEEREKTVEEDEKPVEKITIEKENELHDTEMSDINTKCMEDVVNSLQCDEQLEERSAIEATRNESENICLLPDEEKELTGAEKEQAIQAREIAEKEAAKAIEAAADVIDDEFLGEKDGTRGSTPTEEINDEHAENEIGSDSTDNSAMVELKNFEIKELTGNITEQKCLKCRRTRLGMYKLLVDGNVAYLCDIKCVNLFRVDTEEQYTLYCRRVIITAILGTVQICQKCKLKKNCNYRYKNTEGTSFYLCDSQCLSQFIGKNVEKYLVRRKKYIVEELANGKEEVCIHCKAKKLCKYTFKQDEDVLFICEYACYFLLSKDEPERFKLKKHSVRVRDLGNRMLDSGDSEPKIIARSYAETEAVKMERDESFIRRCAQCYMPVEGNNKLLQWEVMDFCNEICLEKYQNKVGSSCKSCQRAVPASSLGKYCVRFGFDVRQFCCSNCLDCYKKALKVCSLCQKDLSRNKGFLAPIGDKGQFKDFCSQGCLKQYEDLHNSKKKGYLAMCAVCNNKKVVAYEIILLDRLHTICSNPCFSAFKFVNTINPDQCNLCSKFFERKNSNNFTVYQDDKTKIFCSKICMNVFIIQHRKIEPCHWCKVKKYNFDMIQKQTLMLCSLNCLTLYGLSLSAVSLQNQKCDQCKRQTTPQYHLTMSDSTIRNFCTYQCVMLFQSHFGRRPLTFKKPDKDTDKVAPFPTSLPKRIKQNIAAGHIQITQTATVQANKESPVMPVLPPVESSPSNETSTVASTEIKKTVRKGKSRYIKPEDAPLPTTDLGNTSSQIQNKLSFKTKSVSTNTLPDDLPTKIEYKTQIVTVPPVPPTFQNKLTMCKPNTTTRGITCRPQMTNTQTQTEKNPCDNKVIIPIPVPIYVPQPMYMYSAPFPVPVPIPLPIPVPIFIPTTRNSASGILKEIKKIEEKIPSNPYEADLLMMAEMVADENKRDDSDSDEDFPDNNDEVYITETVEPSNSFGEDVLQMAFKLATEYEEPTVDLESAVSANTISSSDQEIQQQRDLQHLVAIEEQKQIRGRKRVQPIDGSIQQITQRNSRSLTQSLLKKKKRDLSPVTQIELTKTDPVEKPDANMCLKYTFGVNAWKQWMMSKNLELEKSPTKRPQFKTELLQMTPDELNYSLSLFVKEVRKPNGSEYAPDTIYYLVLGIQQYLYQNGRIDNIFTDPYYEKFTDCLDEIAKKFSVLYNDSQYIVTRVEEEHLWECKQLGAHSPHVLLTTLMFFNTKHFNITTVDDHMQLSFSHIMKHWKRTNSHKPGGSRNILLRFYPPQSATDPNPRKKKVYEQQENLINPLRCPVRLYEFFLSKCPESVKTRSDVFYLQPERSCVPDSPVWYSTQPLNRNSLSKMLHRVKMVKEINIAILSS